jgi:hypothetical protein
MFNCFFCVCARESEIIKYKDGTFWMTCKEKFYHNSYLNYLQMSATSHGAVISAFVLQ